MTETDWLICTDPTPMLEFLHGKASDRKLRLFAAASCRRIWPLVTDERSRNAIEVYERYADGCANHEKFQVAQMAAYRTARTCSHRSATAAGAVCFELFDNDRPLARSANGAAGVTAYAAAAIFPKEGLGCTYDFAGVAVERSAQTWLVRDLFGPLAFRTVTLDPAWLCWHDAFIAQVAQTIYDERRSGDLPILGDALEDAGCTNQEIVEHCRQPREHFRGYWVIDLLLGKK